MKKLILLISVLIFSCQTKNDSTKDLVKRVNKIIEKYDVNSYKDMLYFKDSLSLNEFIDDIIDLRENAINLESNSIEKLISDKFSEFNSLYHHIESEILAYESNDSKVEFIDYDNLFFPDDNLRMIINHKKEIRVGDIIYKFNEQNQIEEFNLSGIKGENVLFRFGSSINNCAEFYTTELGSNEIGFTPETQNGSDLCTYSWDFGDGNTSSEITTSHVYSQSGVYIVTLKVSCGYGAVPSCNNSYTTILSIGNTPQSCISNNLNCNFEINKLESEIGRVEITSLSETGNKYFIDYGDNNFEFLNSPDYPINHTYLNGGTYEVCLTVTDGKGCSCKNCKKITIENACCRKYNKTDEDWNFYSPGKKYKYTLWRVNAPFYRRVGAKTINYKYHERKKKWVRDKAKKIYAEVSGHVYKEQKVLKKVCETKTNVYADKLRSNKKKASCNDGIGGKFWTKYQSVQSKHYVNGNETEKSLYLSQCTQTETPPELEKAKLFYNTNLSVRHITQSGESTTVDFKDNYNLFGLTKVYDELFVSNNGIGGNYGIHKVFPVFQNYQDNTIEQIVSKKYVTDIKFDNLGNGYVAADYKIHNLLSLTPSDPSNNLTFFSQASIIDAPFSLAINNNLLFIAGANQFAVVDLLTNNSKLIINHGIQMAGFMCFDDNNNLYIADPGDDSVKKLNTTTIDPNTGSGNIDLGAIPILSQGNYLSANLDFRGPIGIDFKENKVWVSIDKDTYPGSNITGYIISINIQNGEQELFIDGIPGPRALQMN